MNYHTNKKKLIFKKNEIEELWNVKRFLIRIFSKNIIIFLNLN